jgi:signal transduction histidine kinase
VRDNGPGLDEQQSRRIFDQFYTNKSGSENGFVR